jgi:superfamily II DNA or RNA helicase
MDYNQLLSAYNALLAENAELKRRLGIVEVAEITPVEQLKPKVFVDEIATVNQASPAPDKINLFMPLFRGREDVFARRWYSQNLERGGYQPVCGNEWKPNVCDKKKYKCKDCPKRALLPISPKDIEKHLTGSDTLGRDVIGVYAMLADENCYFLAVDFDDGDFKDDVSAFRNACTENSVPVAIERSRSGDGAHAWIFFEEAIPARTARRLGSGLLTYAMNLRSKMKFDSYDRLFPNQDYMPNGGFGNLIALPLQGQARKNNNSMFDDEQFQHYPDQWAYLSRVEKLSADKVKQLVSKLCSDSDLGVLVSEDTDEKEPWENKKLELSSNDFAAPVKIVKANMLYVEKQGVSERALNRIKRLGAFRNPDFYKLQKMRLPIFDKPRIISVTENADKYIGIPRGMESKLLELLKDSNADYTVTDKRNHGIPLDVTFNGELYDEQLPAAKALLSKEIGVLSATTAFGKSVIGAYAIAENKVNTLILVHTAALLSQWQKALEEFLIVGYEIPQPENKRGRKKSVSHIGTLGGGKNILNGFIDVAIMNSLLESDKENGEVKTFVRDYGQIIVDECHHVSAVSFEKILKFATAKYVYGLTATPMRQDGHHPIIFMQCGDIAYKVDAESQANKRPFEHYLVPRFTGFKKVTLTDETNVMKIQNELMTSEQRNRLIIGDIKNAVDNGKTPIILTERADHVGILADLLKSDCKNVVTLIGKMSAKEKREAMERLQNIPEDEPLIVVATGKYVGEGFDFPRLDTLFIVMSISWKGKVAQYAGRLHRLYDSKEEVLIYDYVDVHIPVLERMYHKRIRTYANIGYKTRPLEQSAEKTSIIHDSKSYFTVFTDDISKATKEIVIASPYMQKNRLTFMVNVLSEAILNGVNVTIVTRPPEDFKESEQDTIAKNIEYLKSANINVVLRSKIHQKFTVVDGNIMWYGSVSFLAFNKNEESVMRFDSHEIGAELLGVL